MTKDEHLEELIEAGKPTRFQSGRDAAEKGRAGGIKSGEVRREKAEQRRNAREAARYILGLKGSETGRSNLKLIGAKDDDGLTNMEIMMGRLWSMFQGGDLEAGRMFMEYAGYDSKENRAERESLAADRRRDAESEAKLRALGSAPDNAAMAVNMGDEDGNEDVVFYIPQMLDEKECEATDTIAAEGEDKPKE